MWDRKYEHGRWNGVELNILNTSIDGGKRLHVSEIPYADLPAVKVMGSSASKISIDVVFVGGQSLVASNALLADLDKTPKGELEHPWLGEMLLVFESYSQKINTKLGLVTLTLSFVRYAQTAELTPIAQSTTSISVSQQTDEVMNISSLQFVDDVANASIAGVNYLRGRCAGVVTTLQAITNQLHVPSSIHSMLNVELNETMTAISSVANAPLLFAEQLNKTVDSVAKEVRVVSGSVNEAVDNSRMAQASILALIDNVVAPPATPTRSFAYMDIDVPRTHLNIQLVMTAIKMSKSIAVLERQRDFDIVTSKTQPAFILSDLKNITAALGGCIASVTDVSTIASLALYNALVGLLNSIESQVVKVVLGSSPVLYKECLRPVPGLALAHQSCSDEELITILNSSHHPLFLRGAVALAVKK